MDMTWYEIVYFISALLIMLVGMIGTVLPMLPGVPLILGTAFLYAFLTDFQDITGDTLIIFTILTGIALLLDWLGTMFGVKKMGGSYFGVFGSLVGMVVGLSIPGAGIIGFIVGAFTGAVVFEMLIGKKFKIAIKAGIGSMIGFIFGGVVKLAIAATMIGWFIWEIVVS